MDAMLSIMAATVISMLNVAGLMVWVIVSATNVQTAMTAAHMRVWDAGALQYVQDFASTIEASATATTPVTVTTAMMNAAGNYLPVGYSGVNSFGQTLELQVLQPSPGVLQALVTTQGGRPITDSKQLVQIAAQAQAGFVPYAGQGGNAGLNAANAYGAFGAWGPVSLANFTNPGSGHLADLLSFSGASNQANNMYLYRVAVPGQPQLTSMQTDLGMTDVGGTPHDITGASAVAVTGGSELDSDQDGSLELGGNNATAGTGQPYIDFHQTGQGVQDFNVRVQNDANNQLTISSASGQANVQIGGTLQLAPIATPEAACAQNGRLAGISDGSGITMMCSNLKWIPMGGRYQAIGLYTVSNGSVVPAPTCSVGGVGEITIASQNFSVDDTATVNFSPPSGTGPWTMNITDGSGTAIAGTAQAQTFCKY